jgi:hypothetical protein
MTKRNETLRYSMDDFFVDYQKNRKIPKNIIPYFCENRLFGPPDILRYSEQMRAVVTAITNGDKQEDTDFKSTVKYYINTINKTNFADYLEKLSALNLTTVQNVQFLAHELIVCGMRCPIGMKGAFRELNDNIKPLSELCSDIISHFSSNLTEENNNGVGFKAELMKIIQRFFIDFMNIEKAMDEHNENTADNYKGFMTLMGLMYSNGLIQTKVIVGDCIDSIKRTIFNSKLENAKLSESTLSSIQNHHKKMFGRNFGKMINTELYNKIIYFDTLSTQAITSDPNYRICYRSEIECTNYYKGYEYLMNNIINGLSLRTDDMKDNIESLKKIGNCVNSFIVPHQEFLALNKIFKTKSGKNPLKLHLIQVHTEIGTKLQNLSEKIVKLIS